MLSGGTKDINRATYIVKKKTITPTGKHMFGGERGRKQ